MKWLWDASLEFFGWNEQPNTQNRNSFYTTAEELLSENLNHVALLVTGSLSGMGQHTATLLQQHGATIFHFVKNAPKDSNNQTEYFIEMDLANLSSIKQAVECFNENYSHLLQQLHPLVLCNAAVMVPPKLVYTKDGFESQMGINYFGHFSWIMQLLPILNQSYLCKSNPIQNIRIVIVSSVAHRFCHFSPLDLQDLHWNRRNYYFGINYFFAYCQSKFALALFAKELSHQLETLPYFRIYCVHPGVVKTKLGSEAMIHPLFYCLMHPFSKTVAQGAATMVYCLTSKEIEHQTGKYYSNCCEQEFDTLVQQNASLSNQLWNQSLQETNTKWFIV